MSNDYRKVPTSAEVWAVLKARHADELRVYGSYSAPEGDEFGDPSTAVMMTEYAFEDAQWPLMGARTTWAVGDITYPRVTESTQYWLCVRTEGQEQREGDNR